MRKKALFSLVGALIAAIALVSASGAATTKAQKVTRIDVSTRAAVIHYLHSIHVKAKGAVIQRGLHNYAGARCPGKHWACASTRHTVVQITGHGGQNRFACRSAHCVVVQISGVSHGVYIAGRQLAASGSGGSTGVCVKTTGLTQSCSISQIGAGPNKAGVYQNAGKQSGLTQAALYTASITQQSSGSNGNQACVTQLVSLDGSTTAARGKPVVVTLSAHQSVIVKQDVVLAGGVASGINTANQPATSSGACTTGPVISAQPAGTSALTQSQVLTSTANGTAAVTQNEDLADASAINCGRNHSSDTSNMCLDVEQNQGNGFNVATGKNDAVAWQENNLSAIGNTATGGSVNQTQGAQDPSVGGMLVTVNQQSTAKSTFTSTQNETQCEDALSRPTIPIPNTSVGCDVGGDLDPPSGIAVAQNQYGPEGMGYRPTKQNGRIHYQKVTKDPSDSSQTGNNTDTFTVNQNSTQNNDNNTVQKNHIIGGALTSGNGTVNQSALIQNNNKQDVQVGGGTTVQGQIDCSGSTSASCTKTLSAPNFTDKPPATVEIGPHDADFAFANADSTVKYVCKLDTATSYTACPGPGPVSGSFSANLPTGQHTLSVKTQDADNLQVSGGTAVYTWTVVDAQILISPSSTNEVGTSQSFTVTVKTDNGSGSGEQPVSGVNPAVTLSDSNGALHSGVTDGCASTGTNGSGQCTVTFTSASAGQVTGHASASLTVAGASGTATLLRATNDGAHGDSADAVQTFVDAKISISPLTSTEEVGSSHTFAVTLLKNAGLGAGFVPAAGENVGVTLTDAHGAAHTGLAGSCSTGTTDVNGQCAITFNSASAGTVTVNASSTLSVGTVSLTRATGDAHTGDSANAVQTFVDAQISISPLTSTEEVGSSHTFTVTLTKNAGAGSSVVAPGETVAVTLTDDHGAANSGLAGSCVTGVTDSNGQCTITFNSASAGTVTVNARSTLSVGGVSLTRATNDGAHGDSANAVQTFVDAYITISASPAMPTAGTDNEVLTISVYTNDGSGGVYAPADGVPVTASIATDSASSSFSGGVSTCQTDSSGPTEGTCTVTINASSAGHTTVNASFTNLSVGGVQLSRATGDNVSLDSADAAIDWQ